jgi:hypothetical protein
VVAGLRHGVDVRGHVFALAAFEQRHNLQTKEEKSKFTSKEKSYFLLDKNVLVQLTFTEQLFTRDVIMSSASCRSQK